MILLSGRTRMEQIWKLFPFANTTIRLVRIVTITHTFSNSTVPEAIWKHETVKKEQQRGGKNLERKRYHIHCPLRDTSKAIH